MKKTIRIQYDAHRSEEREVNYVSVRYILALALAVLETVAVITILFLFGKYIPYFYLAMWPTEIGWAGIAGDEQQTVKYYADRIAMLHLKDFYPDYRNGQYTRKNMPTEAFAAIGEGGIATKEILAIRETYPNFSGNIIIDQDKTTGDMLKALETGHRNIRTML